MERLRTDRKTLLLLELTGLLQEQNLSFINNVELEFNDLR